MTENPTTGELFKASLILDADVNAAVDAYMADAGTGVFPIGDGYSLDLGNAIDAHPFAHAVVRDPAAVAAVKRTAVRTAILLARPQKR